MSFSGEDDEEGATDASHTNVPSVIVHARTVADVDPVTEMTSAVNSAGTEADG